MNDDVNRIAKLSHNVLRRTEQLHAFSEKLNLIDSRASNY
jgi:hypothetical protein